jgi:hypothetical protein
MVALPIVKLCRVPDPAFTRVSAGVSLDVPHSLPTSSAEMRYFMLEAPVLDADGRVLRLEKQKHSLHLSIYDVPRDPFACEPSVSGVVAKGS